MNKLVGPSLVHIGAALLIQNILALPFALVGYGIAYWFAAAWVSGVYAGRERRQAETGSGSNRIWPWDFSGNRGGWRQWLQPTAAVLVCAGVVTWVF